MLVLDRKIQEGLWIEGRIYVKVLAIGRKRVKLGIEAPRESPIVREELLSAADGARNDGAKPAREAPAEGSVRPQRRRN